MKTSLPHSIRTCCFLAISLLGIFMPGNQERPSAPPESPRTEQELVDQLERIRTQTGGGVREILSDILPNEDTNRIFKEELQRLVQASGKRPQTPHSAPLPPVVQNQTGERNRRPDPGTNQDGHFSDEPLYSRPDGTAGQNRDSRYLIPHQGGGVDVRDDRERLPAHPGRGPHPGDGDRGFSGRHFGNEGFPASIRNSARRLEMVAAELEETGQFSTADEIRRICQQLRESVRPDRSGRRFSPEMTR